MLSLSYNSSLFIHVLGDMRIFFQLHFDVVVLVGFFLHTMQVFLEFSALSSLLKKTEWTYYHQLKALSKRFN